LDEIKVEDLEDEKYEDLKQIVSEGEVTKPTLTQAKDSQRLVNCCVKHFLTRDHVMGWCVGIKVSLFDPQWLQHHE
jgi:hypothetical protein